MFNIKYIKEKHKKFVKHIESDKHPLCPKSLRPIE